VHGCNRDHGLAVPALREHLHRWHTAYHHQGANLVGSLGYVLLTEAQHLFGPLSWIEHEAEHHLRSDRMETVLEGSHHPEVTSATSYAPDQISVLGLAGGKEPAVCGHEIHGYQVVRGQTVLAPQPAYTAA
jgi:hypothetical protein